MNPLKKLFLLDPEVVYLNHGSLGACPRPVFKAYQDWQRRLERQPIQFFNQLGQFYQAARQPLGAYLGADPQDLAFVLNVTHAVSLVSRSLALEAGDEILTTDQEYGACNSAWNFACRKSGALYIHRPVRLPVHLAEEIVEDFWQGVTPRTRLIYLSHITSPTALRLPVEEICRKARQQDILTFIDGAHAPGQIPLNLEELGADFYTGNCHKWMLSPKGAGFLYARRPVQKMVEPLIVSWTYHPEKATPEWAGLADYVEWIGTRDPAAALAVPVAIDFMEKHNWEEVRQACHALLRQAIQRICDLTGLPPLYPIDSGFYSQMGVAPLTPVADLAGLKKRLYEEYRIEMPLIQWKEQQFARISVQGYNSQEDIDVLLKALESCLPGRHST